MAAIILKMNAKTKIVFRDLKSICLNMLEIFTTNLIKFTDFWITRFEQKNGTSVLEIPFEIKCKKRLIVNVIKQNSVVKVSCHRF